LKFKTLPSLGNSTTNKAVREDTVRVGNNQVDAFYFWFTVANISTDTNVNRKYKKLKKDIKFQQALFDKAGKMSNSTADSTNVFELVDNVGGKYKYKFFKGNRQKGVYIMHFCFYQIN